MRFWCRLLRQSAHAHQQMIPPITANTIASGIQMGASTHHHDQEMIPPSFNPMNRIASRPRKPMPPFEVVLLPILICMASVYLAGGRLPGSASRRPRRADGPRAPVRGRPNSGGSAGGAGARGGLSGLFDFVRGYGEEASKTPSSSTRTPSPL